MLKFSIMFNNLNYNSITYLYILTQNKKDIFEKNIILLIN